MFTCDHALNLLVRANRRVVYDLLFEAAAGLLKEYGRKYLGGEIGATGVLHTWGETLELHPHLHFVVTGGACFLGEDGQLGWKHAPANFLFPVLALSRDFRDRVCDGLLKLWREGKLHLTGECANLDVEALVVGMRGKKWEVFIKPAHGQGVTIFEYLGRYINRIAFSNYRLLSIEGGQVRFKYHDNRDGGKEKVMTLEALEFMRRFLLHVLPNRYVRVRHYGLHHSSKRKLLQQCRTLLGLPYALPVVKPLPVVEWLMEILGHHPNQCPRCGAVMMRRGEFGPLGPVWIWLLTLLGLMVRRKATV
ncbi:MAG: transposase [Anaerolineae bacterium]|nr:transposase [Anaerolineae bacterium]